MQRELIFTRESEDERIKRIGLTLDFDEIVKRGKMSKEEVAIAKWYGIYTNRQTGTFMARLTIPGGIITSEQARLIAETAEKYAQGRLTVTTRQDIQYHYLSLRNIPLMMRDLATKGVTTFHGCGDVNRNTTACPMAPVCPYRRFDVLPYAREISRTLARSRDLDNLPRKFKVTLSGCPSGCAQPTINCVGLTAVKRAGPDGAAYGFKALIGGGMGWKAFQGQEVFSFIPRKKVVRFSRAVAVLFRDHGDRFNRAKSRLKFVVDRLGIDACREIILETMQKEGADVSDLETGPVEDIGVPSPKRPLVDRDLPGAEGERMVRIIVPKGDLAFHQFAAIADLSEMYGNQRIVTTNRQNLELHGIEPGNVGKVRGEVARLGLRPTGTNGLLDVLPCVGTTFCPKAVSETRRLYDLVMPVISDPRFEPIRDHAIVNITGCPNSCSPYRIADIGFRGMRIREEMGSVEGYEVRLGGCNERFGEKLGEFKLSDCPAVVERVLDVFMAIREDRESLADTVARLGIAPFEQGVYDGN